MTPANPPHSMTKQAPRKKCACCKQTANWYGYESNIALRLDDSGICELCRPNEPAPGDVWLDTKSTETVRVYVRTGGSVLYHDNVLARDRGPVKKLVRRKFLNRYRFVGPRFATFND